MQRFNQPIKQGLYDPKFEHDACGIGLIGAHLKGARYPPISSSKVLADAVPLRPPRCPRWAMPLAGDGAGILIQLPHLFFQKSCSQLSKKQPGSYGVGMVFLPQDSKVRSQCEKEFERIIAEEGQEWLGWRTVPVDDGVIGEKAKESQPYIRQIIIGKAEQLNEDEFERILYMIRKRTEKRIREQQFSRNEMFYVASLSSRTIVYKGMLVPDQLDQYYLDLQDEDLTSTFVLVHSRYSTNTFPSWERAHPNRMLVHNGEINSLDGNVNWMKAREKTMQSPIWGGKIKELIPIIDENGSDSSSFDNCLEFLVHSGRSLPHAAMMMVPEPWRERCKYGR